MTGRLTTYVLDTTQGCPAAHLAVELWILDPRVESQTQLKVTHTNLGGETDEPLIIEPELIPGTYELLFRVGEYFEHQGMALPKIPFLGEVPIRFGVTDPTLHYHIPLIISPWSYSTYRA
ncbi:MAG: hydroxyisourate hydrolase [Prochlorothrix sp.]|nr:hydroxyisourate hydrolase [Prochlorothrix sp.]